MPQWVSGTLAPKEEGLVTRVSMFNSPLLLGFDQLERTLDRLAKNAEGYPPYNIERIGENGLRITLAVAGFTTDDLQIELVENQLTVRGKQADDTDRVYLHRGIAARQFQRAFMLADGIEVTTARLDNGLLSIDLVRPQLEPRVRTIRIDAGDGDASPSDNTIDISARRLRPR
jgi:HSP20 family molecular chaperone IbpA